MQTCTVTFKDGASSRHMMCPNNGIVVREEGEFIVVGTYGNLSGVTVQELWVKADDIQAVHVRDVAVTDGAAIGGN